MVVFFFFNDTATTEIYTLSLHDALPISLLALARQYPNRVRGYVTVNPNYTTHARGEIRRCLDAGMIGIRSEEHTSELQSQSNLVCRLLLEKKNNQTTVNSQMVTVDSRHG